ncbi:hypothetical protein OAN58_03795 [Paracoccaceae bacterium]|nr:hypothetical protein [Paracoccaceae bacterium]
MRFILTGILILLATNVSAFTYNKVYKCGKNLDKDYLTITKIESFRQYFIHFGNNEEFVIWNQGKQYTTFEAKNYEQLWNQNGATTKLAVLENMGEVIKFELQHLNDNYRKTFIFSLEDLTYISRVFRGDEKYKPEIGVCVVGIAGN